MIWYDSSKMIHTIFMADKKKWNEINESMWITENQMFFDCSIII